MHVSNCYPVSWMCRDRRVFHRNYCICFISGGFRKPASSNDREPRQCVWLISACVLHAVRAEAVRLAAPRWVQLWAARARGWRRTNHHFIRVPPPPPVQTQFMLIWNEFHNLLGLMGSQLLSDLKEDWSNRSRRSKKSALSCALLALGNIEYSPKGIVSKVCMRHCTAL